MEPEYRACPFCAEPIRQEAKVCRFCNRGLTDHSSVQKRRGFLIVVLAAVLVLAGVSVVVLLSRQKSSSAKATTDSSGPDASPLASTPPAAETPPPPAPPLPQYESRSVPLFHGNLAVQPGHYIAKNFTVTDAMLNAEVVGNFHAFGGSGNDIQAVLAAPAEFENWINGHQARVFYSTPGPTTNGDVNVRLSPGAYVFAFSNLNSVVSRKEVSGDISLQFDLRVQ